MIDDLGGTKTYNHYPNGWAMAFNTPFKMWKRYEFNGGTSDPCIISWPAGTKARGEIREQYHHAIDLVPTILDVLGVEPPETIKGHTQIPDRRRQHAVELRRRVRRVEAEDPVLLDARLALDLARGLEGGHDASDDRRLGPLQRRRVGAVPRRRRPRRSCTTSRPSSRTSSVRWSTSGSRRPARTAPSRSTTARRSRSCSDAATAALRAAASLRLLPRRCAACPESQAVNTQNRSFVIGALVDIPKPGAEGVLFAHGTRFGGHALYVKDNRLHYVNNFVGAEEQMVVATEDIPTGENLILSASFDKDGQEPDRRDRHALALPRRQEGRRGEIKTQLGAFAIAGAAAVRRPPGRRARHRRLPRRAALRASPAERSTGSPST